MSGFRPTLSAHIGLPRQIRFAARVASLASLLLSLLLATSVQAAAPEGEEAVESGKRALNQFWEYPWYDAKADKAQPIEVQPPPPPKPPSNLNWDWSWLYDALVYLGWTVFALVIVLIVYLMLRAEWSRTASLIAKEEKPGDTGPVQPDRVEELPFKLMQPNRDFYSTAEEYYREGDYSTAILYLYSYMLLELDKAQVIHLTRGKTNRQYLRETRRFSAAGPVLEPTMVAFEDVFFGHHPLSRERFESCWSQVPHFKLLLTQVSRTGELVAV